MVLRLAYAGQAESARRQMAAGRRSRFDAAMAGTVGRAPYAHGSTPIKGERDYREATVSGAIVVYYVSAGVRTVTAVQLNNL
ncbi:hypothetical protein DEH69_24345 [Streptomyces sp. PT12]|nr:hypothetical protein DEH69_24345 [Streptomyces sp. PT12]